MTEKVNYTITRDDGTLANISIEPDVDTEGGTQHNGIHHLYLIKLEYMYIGDIAFHQQGVDDYAYTGTELSDDELDQIAEFIIKNDKKSEVESPFYVEVFYRGGMASFEVIPNKGHYGIAYDGSMIAEIQYNEDWEQTRGEQLDEDVFITIKQKLERHYEWYYDYKYQLFDRLVNPAILLLRKKNLSE